MVIHLSGYIPDSHEKANRDKDFDIFTKTLGQVLRNEQTLLSDPDSYSIPLSFAYCSWPYIEGSGPLSLGQLLSGWRDGLFKEICPHCTKDALVTSFGGSPLSGTNSWTGYCIDCQKKVSGKDSQHKPFYKRIKYVLELRKRQVNLETSTG